MNKNILVLSDSLALPRKNIKKNFLWPELLKKEGIKVEQHSFGHSTLRQIVDQIPYHIDEKYDCIVIQAGINDILCRAFLLHEFYFFEYFFLGRVLRKFLLLFEKKIRFIRNVSYSKKIHIQNNFKKLCLYSKYIEIIYVCPFYNNMLLSSNKRFRGLDKRINYFNFDNITKKKNENIKQNLSFISFSFLSECFDDDGIHLNEIGHELLKKIIIKNIRK